MSFVKHIRPRFIKTLCELKQSGIAINKCKRIIYKIIVGSVMLFGQETWMMNEHQKRLLSIELDYWHIANIYHIAAGRITKGGRRSSRRSELIMYVQQKLPLLSLRPLQDCSTFFLYPLRNSLFSSSPSLVTAIGASISCSCTLL